jgi:hypothetical protein
MAKRATERAASEPLSRGFAPATPQDYWWGMQLFKGLKSLDDPDALEHYKNALVIHRGSDDRGHAAIAGLAVGFLSFLRGDRKLATECVAKSVEDFAAAGNHEGVAAGFWFCAIMNMTSADWKEASHAGAFALGMAIHNESLAQQQPAHPESLYYCATGPEMPAFAPCKQMKSQRNI